MTRPLCIVTGSLFFILSFGAIAQTTTISGTITDAVSDQPLVGVNIVVKGKVIGTTTDISGNFSLTVNQAPPLTLELSYIGYRTMEESITQPATMGLKLALEEQAMLGQEVVVSASRVEESIMESPVSIEKMDIRAIQNSTADDYYKGLANLKGVDMTTSSINFQIVNTRGFGSTGNTRFVQLTDGMDTQAPALNFPIGNLNGPSELDVESVELIPGASSALYGPNAFNGMILINSKNAFEYQGLSAMVKTGLNHVGSEADFEGPSPVLHASVRYAKAFKNKFAFKVNGSYMQAEDWHGTSDWDRESNRTPDGFPFNPGADRLNYMGDEASIPLAIFRFSSDWNVFASTKSQYYNNILAPGLSIKDYSDAGDLPSHVVSVTPYAEKDLIDYGAKNLKANVGLYFRPNDKMELSYLYNGGFGTSIYTGAQRYSLQNFGIQQHRIQLRGDNFYVRAYTTMENSGDSYITEFLAKRINDLAAYRANPLWQKAGVSGYLLTYAAEYLRYLHDDAGLAPGEIQTLSSSERTQIEIAAHQFARDHVDNGSNILNPMHLDPSSAAFKDIKKSALEGTIPKGPRFADKTNLYHAEGQYDFKNQIDFMELQTGGSYRLYDLNSKGTIFDDKAQNITISEYGAYVQAGKWVGDHNAKISGSARYDKNENFKGRINPRLSFLYKIAENHNIRASYQTGFRNPSTQGQHIDLNTISVRLLGGLPRYAEKYDLPRFSSTGEVLSYTATSVETFRNTIFSTGDINTAIGQLEPFDHFDPVKPERIRSWEVGYKGLINNNLLIDVDYYYNLYNDFITQIIVVTADEFTTDPSKVGEQYSQTANAALNGTPNYLTMLNGTAHEISANIAGGIDGNTSSLYTNAPGQVTAQGLEAGITYTLLRGYTIGYNYNWNTLQNVPKGFIAEYNTPEHKMNISFGNRKLTERVGFNVTLRWQSEFDWQSSFTSYKLFPVPAYSTLDAQVNYKLPGIKSILKVGASNVLNQKYIQSGGGPNIGGLYYMSITFDELMHH